jgi:uncharacterized RDD family membrane protein YckC
VRVSRQRQRGGPPRRQAGAAGFWRRALAALVDALLIAIVGIAAEAGYLGAEGAPPQQWRIDPADPAQPIALGAVLLVAALYDVILTRRLGGTVGKRLLGLRVESREGGPPGTGQLLGRLFGRIVSALPALLGFLWALWDRRKQTWHDKLADTVVLRDGSPRPAPAPHQDTGGLGLSADLAPAAMAAAGHVTATPDHHAPESTQQPVDRAPAADPAPAPAVAAQAAPAQPPPAQATAAEPATPAAYGAPQQPSFPSPQQPAFASPHQPFAPAEPPQAIAAPPPNGAPPQPASASPWAPQAPQQPAWGGPGLTPPPPPARNDPNSVAIGRAGLGQDAAAWLQQVAGQVDARLDRVSVTWRTSPHAEAARACAFGLLLGHLARLYPHMRPELNATAELHPSFSTLMEGARLATLEQIVAEPGRVAAWLGPLIDVQDPGRLRTLLD